MRNVDVMKVMTGILVLMMFFSSCKDLFQYSPNEVRLEENERNINVKNIARIKLAPASSMLNFILVGDTQRFYDEVDDFVKLVNDQPDIDFVVVAGDISDFGLNKEFRWINERLSKLKVPYIAVIGNHDMISNGRKVYQQMFGPENFSFSHNGTKIICLNTNSEEVGFDGSLPDLNWLQKELDNSSGSDNVVVISHVPPFSAAFDKNLIQPFNSMLVKSDKVRLSLHGHQHTFSSSTPYEGEIPYIVSAAMNKRNCMKVTITNDGPQFNELIY